MKYNKYYKDNNIIHDVLINGFEELKLLINNNLVDSLFKNNEEFTKEFKEKINKINNNINIRYQKEYTNYGNKPIVGKIINQNINCYKINDISKYLNIYYDLVFKYNTSLDVKINTFIITYALIEKLKRNGYNVNFIPVLFLKAFDKIDNNEYIFIKFNNVNIINILKYNIILNSDIVSNILPKIIELLNIENKNELNYNGYLLERIEKDNIIESCNNDLIIDIFTSDGLFNGNIEHDSEIFYKKLKFNN